MSNPTNNWKEVLVKEFTGSDTTQELVMRDLVDLIKEVEQKAREEGYLKGQEEARNPRPGERDILTVGWHKHQMEFGVNMSIQDLGYEDMRKFREMIVVAIGVAEDAWKRRPGQETPKSDLKIKE